MSDAGEPGRPTKFPGIEEACETVIEIGRNGKGKAAMAAALNVCKQTLLRWMDPGSDQYKGERFCDAVHYGLTLGEQALMEKLVTEDDQGVCGLWNVPGEKQINTGVLKFIAQHQYGLVDKQQVEQSGSTSIQINVSDEEAGL